MSRHFDADYFDCDENPEDAEASFDEAVNAETASPAGQAALRSIRDALLDLQAKGMPALTHSAIYNPDNGMVCTIGAKALREKGEDALTRAVQELVEERDVEEFGELNHHELMEDAMEWAFHLGIPSSLAQAISLVNDHYERDYTRTEVVVKDGIRSLTEKVVRKAETPEERFTRMLAWVEKRILPEPAGATA